MIQENPLIKKNLIKSRYSSSAQIDKKNYQMAQVFRNQVEDLKQLKKSLSNNNFSRFNNMKKIQKYKLQDWKVQNPLSARQYRSQLKFQNKSDELKKKQEDRKAMHLFLVTHQISKKSQQIADQQSLQQLKQIRDKVQNEQKEKEINQDDFEQKIESPIINQKITLQQNPQIQQIVKIQPSNRRTKTFQFQSNKKFQQESLQTTSLYNIGNYPQTSKRQTQMNLSKRLQSKLMQSKQKIAQNKIRILQKQTNFKLQRKVKQNMELLQKRNLLKQIIYYRMQRDRQMQKKKQLKKAEQRFIRESRLLKIQIQKKSKIQNQKQQKLLRRTQSQQSALNMEFNRYLQQMQTVKKQQELMYKSEFLKSGKTRQIIYIDRHDIKLRQKTSRVKDNKLTPYQATLSQMNNEFFSKRSVSEYLRSMSNSKISQPVPTKSFFQYKRPISTSKKSIKHLNVQHLENQFN